MTLHHPTIPKPKRRPSPAEAALARVEAREAERATLLERLAELDKADLADGLLLAPTHPEFCKVSGHRVRITVEHDGEYGGRVEVRRCKCGRRWKRPVENGEKP